MPDISMCLNKECPKRNECYRYTAEPNPFRQSYSKFQYQDGDNGFACGEFWDNKPYQRGYTITDNHQRG